MVDASALTDNGENSFLQHSQHNQKPEEAGVHHAAVEDHFESKTEDNVFDDFAIDSELSVTSSSMQVITEIVCAYPDIYGNARYDHHNHISDDDDSVYGDDHTSEYSPSGVAPDTATLAISAMVIGNGGTMVLNAIEDRINNSLDSSLSICQRSNDLADFDMEQERTLPPHPIISSSCLPPENNSPLHEEEMPMLLQLQSTESFETSVNAIEPIVPSDLVGYVKGASCHRSLVVAEIKAKCLGCDCSQCICRNNDDSDEQYKDKYIPQVQPHMQLLLQPQPQNNFQLYQGHHDADNVDETAHRFSIKSSHSREEERDCQNYTKVNNHILFRLPEEPDCSPTRPDESVFDIHIDNVDQLSDLEDITDDTSLNQSAAAFLLRDMGDFVSTNDITHHDISPGKTTLLRHQSRLAAHKHIFVTPIRTVSSKHEEKGIIMPSDSAEFRVACDGVESSQVGLANVSMDSTGNGDEIEEPFFTPPCRPVKRLSFADDHGLPLEHTQKLEPRLPTSGRVIVLLLAPAKRVFEFIQVEYPIDDSTTFQVLSEQLPVMASNPVFHDMKFVGLLRIKGSDGIDDRRTEPISSDQREQDDDDSRSTTSALTTTLTPTVRSIMDSHALLGDAGFRNCELVLAVPEDLTCSEVVTHALPLLLNSTIIKALHTGRRSGRGLKMIKSGEEWNKDNSSNGDRRQVNVEKVVLQASSRECNVVADLAENVVVFEVDMNEYVTSWDETRQLADGGDKDVSLPCTGECREPVESLENEISDGKITNDVRTNHCSQPTPFEKLHEVFPGPEPDPTLWKYVGGPIGAEYIIASIYFVALAGVSWIITEHFLVMP